MITDENISKYQEIHRKYFGEEIPREDARAQGTALFRFMQLVYKPMTQEEYDEAVALAEAIKKLQK